MTIIMSFSSRAVNTGLSVRPSCRFHARLLHCSLNSVSLDQEVQVQLTVQLLVPHSVPIQSPPVCCAVLRCDAMRTPSVSPVSYSNCAPRLPAGSWQGDQHAGTLRQGSVFMAGLRESRSCDQVTSSPRSQTETYCFFSFFYFSFICFQAS